MKKLMLCLLLSSLTLSTFAQPPSSTPRAFISISGTLGGHSISFKDFANSPGFSFGYSVSLGIYAVTNPTYKGGLVLTLLEGASRNKNRRQQSIDFDLPHATYDKHEIFNFAQFRSGNIGWFSEFKVSEGFACYHQVGFGIFGTTEKDPLLDFGMSHQAGILTGNENGFRFRLGINYDTTFGTGNPNYKQNNVGITFGGYRNF